MCVSVVMIIRQYYSHNRTKVDLGTAIWSLGALEPHVLGNDVWENGWSAHSSSLICDRIWENQTYC